MINNNVNSGSSFNRSDTLRSEQSSPKAVVSKPGTAPPPSTGEQVKLSSNTQLKSLESKLAKLPDVNASKVEELKTKIENGEYSVDTERLADKILASDLQLP